jgi:hypothetical protein
MEFINFSDSHITRIQYTSPARKTALALLPLRR